MTKNFHHDIKQGSYQLQLDETLEPIYEEFKGWSENLRNLRNSDMLPENLNNYINFLEKKLNIPIVIVSVGPDRKETLFR